MDDEWLGEGVWGGGGGIINENRNCATGISFILWTKINPSQTVRGGAQFFNSDVDL